MTQGSDNDMLTNLDTYTGSPNDVQSLNDWADCASFLFKISFIVYLHALSDPTPQNVLHIEKVPNF